MKNRMTKTIGILGGMGPEATARFFELVIKNTAAKKDREHLRIIVFNYPQVPDRTAAILYGGENPVPYMIKGLKTLEKTGAKLVAIPCMTAHYFLPEIKTKTRPRLKVIDLIAETVSWTKVALPRLNKVGLLATEGTIATGIFQSAYEKKGIRVLIPSKSSQKKIMEAIYGKKGIKAGFGGQKPRRLLLEASEELLQHGAQALIAGCTEIPLVIRPDDIPVPLIDPMTIGARALINKAGGKLRDLP